MHSEETVEAAISMSLAGMPATAISRLLGVPRATVRDWVAGRIPRLAHETRERAEPRAQDVPEDYVYLLGLYLGDGCLSAHPRDVFRLRVFLDMRYPGIVAECAAAMTAVRPASRVDVRRRPGTRMMQVSAYSKTWPKLFPQHGPGRKHRREIRLEPWQEELVGELPDVLLRGLIHSDGCRFQNTGRGGWVCPRYAFSNRSRDIRAIFCAACERLDMHWTSAPHTIYVSRKEDVAVLDEFVGPKT